MMEKTFQISKKLQYEAEFVDSLASMLQMDGYKIRREVPNSSQSIDLVATKGRWVTAVEVKTSNWKKAIAQCKSHEILADFICIAIASVRVSENLILEAQARGYGIIHFNRDVSRFTWHLRPALNKQLWPPLRRIWARNLREISHER